MAVAVLPATVVAMTVIGASVPGMLLMHIGLAEPGSPGAAPRPRLPDSREETPLQERSALVGGGIDWAKYGVQPRWLGQESSECAVALEPGIFHTSGDVERKRFLAGAADRGEVALVVSSIGDVNDQHLRTNVFNNGDSVRMSLLDVSIGGPRLPAGTSPKLAPGLDQADQDLGKRLLNRPPAAWWELAVRVVQSYTGGRDPLAPQEPDGTLHPILVDALGHPVVAVWTSSEENLRWYIIPDGADWATVIDWLVAKALPAHAPGALRRARHPGFIPPDLQTEDEARARQSLADLEEEHARRKTDLEEVLRRAEERATPVRNGLLYGVGSELEDAVAQVFKDAGLTVVRLDSYLSTTDSADLLITWGSEHRLVEVKSAGGGAPENLVDFLRKHLSTWPVLKPDLPASRGVLIVNHQHKQDPQDRAAKVYERKAFVASLAYPVLSTRELFDWWSARDWSAVRAAVIGPGWSAAPAPGDPVTGGDAASPAQPADSKRRRWRHMRDDRRDSGEHPGV
jgi:hypothetical protein